MRDRIRLFLLGGTEIRGVPGDLGNRFLGQSKCVALVAYLALAAPGRYQRRDKLVGLFWPELDQAHARTALRKAVHTTRSLVGDDVLLSRGDEELGVNSEALMCDAMQFALLADSGQVYEALTLYRGDLLEGFFLADCAEFGLWLDGERDAARERAAAAAQAFSRKLEQDGDLTLAGTWARKAVHFAWTNERVLRRSLSMLDRLGDRAAAVRLYSEFARRLREEYGAEPSSETRALVEALKRVP